MNDSTSIWRYSMSRWWRYRSVRFLRRIVQIHSVLEATSSIQIPHGLVVGFRHNGRNLFVLRVSVIEHIRGVVLTGRGIEDFCRDDNLHVVQLRVNNMCRHFDVGRHFDAALETYVGNVHKFRAMLAVSGDLQGEKKEIRSFDKK